MKTSQRSPQRSTWLGSTALKAQDACLSFQGKIAKRPDRIDSAGGQKHWVAAMPTKMLQAIYRAPEIGRNQIAPVLAVARMHARLWSAFDEQVRATGGLDVCDDTDIAVMKFDPA